MVEMVVREPILDYLLPESEISLIVAGLTVVAGAFGFAVAYNLLVEEDTTHGSDSENGNYRQGNGSGGNEGDLGPRTPTQPRSTNNTHGQDHDSPLVLQPARHPRLMFTRSSTYLLTGNSVYLLMLSIAFIITIVQRSSHLSKVGKEKSVCH